MKSRTKWILLSILILLLVLFGLQRFYVYVQQDKWGGEAAAIEKAKQESNLVQADKVWKSVWDKVLWIVQGSNDQGQEMMVWLEDGKEPQKRLLSEGMSEEAIIAIINQELPNAKIKRLVPGIYNNTLVWQLFYKQQEHYIYRFYDFHTGKPLADEYTLPNR